MAIDTHTHYIPQHTLPLYTKIVPPEFNDYKLWEEYDIRYDDEVRAKESEGRNTFNYAHECVLVGKSVTEFGKVHPLMMAFCGHSRDSEDAVRRICAGGERYDDDREVAILTFIRKDKAKEFILEDWEPIEHPFTKEDAEA